MRFLHLAIMLVVDVSLADLDVCKQENPQYNTDLDAQWQTYIDTYEKKYSSETESGYRRCVWERNLAEIQEFNNAPGNTYTKGENQFTDMTFSEFSTSYLKDIPQDPIVMASVSVSDDESKKLPESVDYRETFVTDVKSQGKCGSCWAFSSTGAIEGQHAKTSGTLVSLSEQNLIDCSRNYGTDGCDGGDPRSAFQYVIANKGINTETCYPYTAKNDSECNFINSTDCIGAVVTAFHNVHPDERSLQKACAENGPISVGVRITNNFKNYKGKKVNTYKNEIFVDSTCGTGIVNHAVLVVGYTPEYWIVKNCWGSQWGLNGYIKMARNHSNCQIASAASYVTTVVLKDNRQGPKKTQPELAIAFSIGGTIVLVLCIVPVVMFRIFRKRSGTNEAELM